MNENTYLLLKERYFSCKKLRKCYKKYCSVSICGRTILGYLLSYFGWNKQS